MDYFGINSPEDLPKIKEVLADQIVEPTVVHHTEFEQSETLAVSDNGELIKADGEPEGEEGYVNGHVFEGMEVDYQSTEDAPTEEAVEEFIADETFIEGDEEETEENIEEEISAEEETEDSEGSGDDEETEQDDVDSEKKEE